MGVLALPIADDHWGVIANHDHRRHPGVLGTSLGWPCIHLITNVRSDHWSLHLCNWPSPVVSAVGKHLQKKSMRFTSPHTPLWPRMSTGPRPQGSHSLSGGRTREPRSCRWWRLCDWGHHDTPASWPRPEERTLMSQCLELEGGRNGGIRNFYVCMKPAFFINLSS